MPLKFVPGNDNVFQLLGDFVPQALYWGLAPGPAGDFHPPDLLACAVLKFALKIPWLQGPGKALEPFPLFQHPEYLFPTNTIT